MTTAICSLVRNEADKFLPQALKAWGQISDIILVLDDNSTDGTMDVLQAYDGEIQIKQRESPVAAWGNESVARRELWDMAQASNCDWLFFLDADMCPAADPRRHFTDSVDACSFWLYDLWQVEGQFRYRSDNFWKGHTWPRTWAVRNPKNVFVPEWSDRGVHCGHLPTNLTTSIEITPPPPSGAMLHYAYSTPALRQTKYEQYASIKDQLSVQEVAHAASILDPEPNTFPLNFTPELTIV